METITTKNLNQGTQIVPSSAFTFDNLLRQLTFCFIFCLRVHLFFSDLLSSFLTPQAPLFLALFNLLVLRLPPLLIVILLAVLLNFVLLFHRFFHPPLPVRNCKYFVNLPLLLKEFLLFFYLDRTDSSSFRPSFFSSWPLDLPHLFP